MIEHGRANNMPWERSVVFITSNVGTELSLQIAQDRAKVRPATALPSAAEGVNAVCLASEDVERARNLGSVSCAPCGARECARICRLMVSRVCAGPGGVAPRATERCLCARLAVSVWRGQRQREWGRHSVNVPCGIRHD